MKMLEYSSITPVEFVHFTPDARVKAIVDDIFNECDEVQLELDKTEKAWEATEGELDRALEALRQIEAIMKTDTRATDMRRHITEVIELSGVDL